VVAHRFPAVAVMAAAVLGLVVACAPDPADPGPPNAAEQSRPLADTAPRSAPLPSTMPEGARSPAPRSAGARVGLPQGATAPLTLFYVAVEDGGIAGPAIGCGDSLVAEETEPVSFRDPVEAALERLLADKEQFHGKSGLLNALHRSHLTFVSSTVDGDTVEILLTGRPVSGGACDDPRIQEQLRYTAQVAARVGKAVILVDGAPIEDVASLK
jgi:hypothetical protein